VVGSNTRGARNYRRLPTAVTVYRKGSNWVGHQKAERDIIREVQGRYRDGGDR